MSLVIRKRSTVGLKSTPNEVPVSVTLSCDFLVADPDVESMEYTPPASPSPTSSPLAGR